MSSLILEMAKPLTASFDAEFWGSFLGSKDLLRENGEQSNNVGADSLSVQLHHLLPPENSKEIEMIRHAEAAIDQQFTREELQQFELSLLGDQSQFSTTTDSTYELQPSSQHTELEPRDMALRANKPEPSISASGGPGSPDSSLEAPNRHDRHESSGYGSPSSPPQAPAPDKESMKELLHLISWNKPVTNDVKK